MFDTGAVVCSKRHSLVIFAFFLFFTAAVADAGECLMSDEDLLQDVITFAESAKKGGLGSRYHGSDLYCWNGTQNAKMRSVLADLLFDSRIHPAHVAAALQDYESVFGSDTKILDEVRKKQGADRFAVIMAVHGSAGAAAPSAALPRPAENFPADADFIDGPANVRTAPKGALVDSLPDNTRVSVLRKQDAWVEIEAKGVRGWTSRTNLMSSHTGAVDTDGSYVLSRAAYLGYAETVRFLLSRGAKPGLVDGSGRNALLWAVRGAFSGLAERELDMVKLLAGFPGADANGVDKDGMTALLTAVTLERTDILNVLLGVSGVNVNQAGAKGQTPLMRAIEYQKLDMVAALLQEKGLDPEAVDERGWTALYLAVSRGNREAVRALMDRKARTDRVTADGKTVLHALFEPLPWRLSADHAAIELVKLLVERTDIDINRADAAGRTVLSLAIEQDNAPMVKLLLARPDLDVNRPLPGGGSSLQRVIGLSNLRHGYEMALALLDRPEIDVNARGYSNRTVVFMDWYNVGYGEHGIALAKKILARRPDLNARDKDGDTPLLYNIGQDHVEMVRLLVAAPGIDLDLPDTGSGKTPLGMAKYRGRKEIVDILTAAGAHEFPLIGTAERTPEGIPQALLQDENASQAITFYRNYLLETTGRTLQLLRDKKTDDAIQLQEFILDEIVAELADPMPKFSVEQRKRAVGMYTAIRDHYRRLARSQSAWFKALPDEKKEFYAKLDAMRDEVLAGKYDAAPDGELAKHPPMLPILILREYMAQNAFQALKLMRDNKIEAADKFLQSVVDRSTSKHQVDPRYVM